MASLIIFGSAIFCRHHNDPTMKTPKSYYQSKFWKCSDFNKKFQGGKYKFQKLIISHNIGKNIYKCLSYKLFWFIKPISQNSPIAEQGPKFIKFTKKSFSESSVFPLVINFSCSLLCAVSVCTVFPVVDKFCPTLCSVCVVYPILSCSLFSTVSE